METVDVPKSFLGGLHKNPQSITHQLRLATTM